MLEWRLDAYQDFINEGTRMSWVNYPSINYNVVYFSAPKDVDGPKSLDEVDPELLKTYDKLGIPLKEQEILSGVKSNIAVDAVFDSVSVVTTFKEKLSEEDNFCSISEAIKDHPELVRKYLSSVIPKSNNYYSASILPRIY